MKILSVILSFILALSSAPIVKAQTADHLVPVAELKSALTAKALEREAHIAAITTLLRREEIRDDFGGLLDLGRVENVVPALDDETLSELGAKARQANTEIAAAGVTKWALITAAVVVGGLLLFAIIFSDK